MKILDKNEMQNIKGGCPPSRQEEPVFCISTSNCDLCLYRNGDITEVCATVLDE